MAENVNCTPDFTTRERCWLPNHRSSPSTARRLLRGLLARIEGGEQFADAGELVVSELVTNAWRHGTRPGHLILLRLAVDNRGLLVEVHDSSSTEPQLRRPEEADEESGRGLHLVAQLSTDWGWGPREGIGKRVWALCPPTGGAAAGART